MISVMPSWHEPLDFTYRGRVTLTGFCLTAEIGQPAGWSNHLKLNRIS